MKGHAPVMRLAVWVGLGGRGRRDYMKVHKAANQLQIRSSWGRTGQCVHMVLLTHPDTRPACKRLGAETCAPTPPALSAVPPQTVSGCRAHWIAAATRTARKQSDVAVPADVHVGSDSSQHGCVRCRFVDGTVCAMRFGMYDTTYRWGVWDGSSGRGEKGALGQLCTAHS